MCGFCCCCFVFFFKVLNWIISLRLKETDQTSNFFSPRCSQYSPFLHCHINTAMLQLDRMAVDQQSVYLDHPKQFFKRNSAIFSLWMWEEQGSISLFSPRKLYTVSKDIHFPEIFLMLLLCTKCSAVYKDAAIRGAKIYAELLSVVLLDAKWIWFFFFNPFGLNYASSSFFPIPHSGGIMKVILLPEVKENNWAGG